MPDKEKTGIEKARETAEKLKAANTQTEEKELAKKEEVKNEMEALGKDSELAKMYNDNASVGSENLSGNAPYLKVHAAGKSSTNFLVDGKKPNDGWFFYKPTQEQLETIECHILTISRGFRAEGLNEKEGKKEMVFNQVMGGVIINDGRCDPFIMFLTGVKLSPMWDFGKEAARWTKAKPYGIPMFTLTVKLTTEEVKTSFGMAWKINFEILKNLDQTPKLVMDTGEFQFLKDNVATTEEIINSLIAAKTAGEAIEDQPVKPLNGVRTADVVDAEVTGDGQEADPNNVSW